MSWAMHADVMQAADILLDILLRRLPIIVRQRARSPEQLQHPVWEWVTLCLPAYCATVCLAGHVISEEQLERVRDGSFEEALLCADTTRFVCSLLKPHLQGAYVYWDTVWKFFPRAGKACSDEADLGSRHEQHKAAVRKGGGSLFYNLYPSEGHVNPLYASQRRGFFEHLTPFIAMAFDRNNAKMLITDRKEGGILEWTPSASKMAQRMKSTSADGKKRELASYFMEFGSGLMLNPQHNASESMGFEGLGFSSEKSGAPRHTLLVCHD